MKWDPAPGRFRFLPALRRACRAVRGTTSNTSGPNAHEHYNIGIQTAVARATQQDRLDSHPDAARDALIAKQRAKNASLKATRATEFNQNTVKASSISASAEVNDTELENIALMHFGGQLVPDMDNLFKWFIK